MSQPIIIIDEKELLKICDIAHDLFLQDSIHEHRDKVGMQAALMVKAVRGYLISKGVEPGFKVALKGQCIP